MCTNPAACSLGQGHLPQFDWATAAVLTTNAWRARLYGPLDIPILRCKLAAASGHHNALRTTLHPQGDGLVKVVAPTGGVTLPVTDLTMLPSSQREQAAAEASRADARCPVQVDIVGWRAQLLRLAIDDHLLMLTAHAAVLDRASLRLLGAEISDRRVGSTPPELTAGYTGWVGAERECHRGVGFEQLANDCRNRLDDLPPLDLPTDRSRPAHPDRQAAFIARTLPADLLREIGELAASMGADPATALRLGFALLLHRYAGQPLLGYASTASSRTAGRTDALGPFEVPVLLRSLLTDGPTFTDLLPEATEAARAAVPFGRPSDRDERGCAAYCAVEPAWSGARLAGATVAESAFEPTDIIGCDLELRIELSTQARCAMAYREDLFDRATMQRMLGHFERLLRGAIEHPDLPAARLPLLSDDERRQILVEWNETVAPLQRDNTVHGVFERQVRRRPKAIAVICGNDQLTYQELNERANQLARHLQARGARRGTLIAVCLERSAEPSRRGARRIEVRCSLRCP